MIRDDDLNAVRELAHGAAADGHSVVPWLLAAVVVEPAVHDARVLAQARARIAVTVDGVAVQVEGDVVGPDHEAVAGAVDQVRVERRVLRHHVAALDVVRECLTAAHEQRGHGQRREKAWANQSGHPSPPFRVRVAPYGTGITAARRSGFGHWAALVPISA